MSTFWVSGDVEEHAEGDVSEDRGEPEREETCASLGQAWEIDFGPSDDHKPKKLPRFLSKMKKPQVSVKATPSLASSLHTEVTGRGRSLSSSQPKYQKSTPSRVPVVKSRNVLSAPAKSSGRLTTSSTKSTSQPRASTATKSSSASRTSSTAARNTSSSLSASNMTRPASAPSKAAKPGLRRTAAKLLFSKQQKQTPSLASATTRLPAAGKKKLSSIWKKMGSKEQIRVVDSSEREFQSEGSEGGGGGLREPDINSKRRALSLRSPRQGRGVPSFQNGGGRAGRYSASSQRSNTVQSNDGSWTGEGAWGGGPTDERGFGSSGAIEGSWGRAQQKKFERMRLRQFSPRLQTTPDMELPSSRVTHRKLEEVQRWVHEVTIHTQQQGMSEEAFPVGTLPDGTGGRGGVTERGERGNGAERRLAVDSEELASRKVLDLRRW